MRASEKIIDFISGFEKLRLKAYKPTPEDVWTIGWGHTRGVKEGDTCTKTQAKQWLRMDVGASEGAIQSLVDLELEQHQYDALISLIFNIGIGAFKSSDLLVTLNNADFKKVPSQIKRWNKQKGKVLSGLTKRRDLECNIWTNGEYGVP